MYRVELINRRLDRSEERDGKQASENGAGVWIGPGNLPPAETTRGAAPGCLLRGPDEDPRGGRRVRGPGGCRRAGPGALWKPGGGGYPAGPVQLHYLLANGPLGPLRQHRGVPSGLPATARAPADGGGVSPGRGGGGRLREAKRPH